MNEKQEYREKKMLSYPPICKNKYFSHRLYKVKSPAFKGNHTTSALQNIRDNALHHEYNWYTFWMLSASSGTNFYEAGHCRN